MASTNIKVHGIFLLGYAATHLRFSEAGKYLPAMSLDWRTILPAFWDKAWHNTVLELTANAAQWTATDGIEKAGAVARAGWLAIQRHAIWTNGQQNQH
jgi:hypothetical protein